MSSDLPIIAYHVSFGAYGFWLPNDPRGSWSEIVWAPNLVPFGPPTPANTRKSLAKAPHDHSVRLAAKQELEYPAVEFTAEQIKCIAGGIGEEVRRNALRVYAAAVMPDHVHVVYARDRYKAEEWVGFFKRGASRALRNAGLHPFANRPLAGGRLHSPWEELGWRAYLHTLDEISWNARYAEQNPIKAQMPAQHWDWVTPF